MLGVSLDNWMTDEDGSIAFGPAPAMAAGEGFLMRRGTKTVNGITYEGTNVGVFVAQPAYNQWVQIDIDGNGLLYYFLDTTGNSKTGSYQIFNELNDCLLFIDAFGTSDSRQMQSCVQFFPDSVIDFRPYISQINS